MRKKTLVKRKPIKVVVPKKVVPKPKSELEVIVENYQGVVNHKFPGAKAELMRGNFLKLSVGKLQIRVGLSVDSLKERDYISDVFKLLEERFTNELVKYALSKLVK